MPLKHILGIDHLVITVRDLDASATIWRDLGFTVSPRGTHTQLGSGNYTIVFEDDYLELLGVVAETEHLKPTIEFLKKREGIERAAFKTDDAAAGAQELRSRGLAALGPTSFGRPVERSDGSETDALFNVFRWPLDEAPGSVRIFACEHLTPEAVWLPELQKHANGAKRIDRLEILTENPLEAAQHLSRLIDQPVTAKPDGLLVPSGGLHADFVFYDPATFAAHYPEVARVGAARAGAVAIVLVTSDIAKAKGLRGAITHGDNAVSIPAKDASGVIVRFIEEQKG